VQDHEGESDWVIVAQKGDEQAFGRLVEAYQRPVFNLCYRMLGNTQDAEDASQETFLRAYRSLRSYDNTRAFSTWLLSIAAHHCIDQLRRRRPVVSVEELPVPDLPDGSVKLETKLTKKEERTQIRKLLNSLEPTDRAAVIMYYWYDFSYAEISQALKITESAVKSRLHRARRLMSQRWLEDNRLPILAAERIPV
jgi:RNA polymerase sigma-70 factor, ECF subfamily